MRTKNKIKETKGGSREKNTKGGTETGSEKSVKVITAPTTLSPYEIFERAIKRASNLINFHKEKEKESEEHYGDAFRAAVVLSISALDAYVRTLVIEKIKEQLAIGEEPLNQKLSEYIKNLLNQDKLLDAARKYNLHEVVEKHIREDFETKSFQGEWKINFHMELAGYKDIFQQVSIKADISEKKLIMNLNDFTKRRHIIAHAGDYDLNQIPHKENEIDKKYASECVNIVQKFAANIKDICQKK